MANPDDTIDPNDLDSIDALLDEAEWNMDDDLDKADAAPIAPQGESLTPEVSEAPTALEEESFDLESIDAEIEAAQNAQTAVEPEPERVTEAAPELTEPEAVAPVVEDSVDLLDAVEEVAPAVVSSVNDAPKNQQNLQASTQLAPEVDEIEKQLAERKIVQKNSANELTAEEMDSLKKLIIIFGSVSIVLILTAIGLTTWSAIAASHAGISEENQTLLESMKVGTELNSEITRANSDSLSTLEKKVDAINFQIEQLAVDLASASKKVAQVSTAPVAMTHTAPVAVNTHDTHAVNDHATTHDTHNTNTHTTTTHTTAPIVATPAPVAMPSQADAKMTAEITEKVSSVNYKLIKAQKTIDDLTSRIRALQAQQKLLIDSVKIVEKEILTERAEKLKKQQEAKEAAEKAKQTQQNNAYQYGAPTDVFYDQGVKDSFP